MNRLGIVAALAACVGLGACSTVSRNYAKPHTEALPPVVDTPSAQYVQSEQDLHAEGSSGFRLLTLNSNALMSRLALAEEAKQSLDLQYYIFRDDETGRLVAQHLLKAADRGVRVRLLLDDLTQGADTGMLDALDSHPNIEVRLFNPFRSRNAGTVSRAAQMLLEFRRLNRRMHNKSFISDNKVAIIGGRNIADDYFDAHEASNFRDLDVVAIGPVVQEASKAFDGYWNDQATVPVSAYRKSGDPAVDLVKLRKELDAHVKALAASDYAQAMLAELPDGATADRKGEWFWGNAVLIADKPGKIGTEADDTSPGLRIGPALRKLIDGAKSEVLIMSPYFVPSDEDEAHFVSLAKRGVGVKVLTNSLASTDQIAVHSGYADHRRELIQGGVELYELKAVAGVAQTDAQKGRKSSIALHAKSFVVDKRWVFVGSLNMDQRSAALNTEMGLVADSPDLAKAVTDYFLMVTQPANAYRVGLEKNDSSGQLVWFTLKDGKPVTLTEEPGVGVIKHTEVMLLKLLPLESLL